MYENEKNDITICDIDTSDVETVIVTSFIVEPDTEKSIESSASSPTTTNPNY